MLQCRFGRKLTWPKLSDEPQSLDFKHQVALEVAMTQSISSHQTLNPNRRSVPTLHQVGGFQHNRRDFDGFPAFGVKLLCEKGLGFRV